MPNAFRDPAKWSDLHCTQIIGKMPTKSFSYGDATQAVTTYVEQQGCGYSFNRMKGFGRPLALSRHKGVESRAGGVNHLPVVCFLLGLPRSGTTLLAHLLQQHPDILARLSPGKCWHVRHLAVVSALLQQLFEALSGMYHVE
ncbi:sulfotransferase [Bradyrhizobium cenepequi]|uniref:sulfotransferase n=1 Tax=Bradyrhizobium cenepequi TaxID=2821403 RepID=UPI002897D90F|nr:sulfotransferase [Bradyrhizobium cenepequi]